MDVVLRSKGQVKRYFQTKITEIDAALGDPDTTEVRLKTLQAQIDQKWDFLRRAYENVESLVDATNGDADSLTL